jgi:hypothetical protein
MKYIVILIVSIVTFKSFAQTEFGFDKSGNVMYLDYIDKDNAIKDLRIRKAGDKAISLLTFVPFGFIKSDVGDGIQEVNTDHRITERLVPNYKYYLSDKNTVSASLFIKSLSSKYSGTNTKESGLNLAEDSINSGQGIYLRTAFDRHLTLKRMRTFDMDFYAGASLSFGLLATTKYSNIIDKDDLFKKRTTRGNAFGLGMDVYGGMAFQFERWSLGAEILSFGLDYSKGFGAEKLTVETKDKTETKISYNGKSFDNALSNSQSLISMYRGVRIVFSYYF